MAATERREVSIHEVDFCGQIASAANILFTDDRESFPFGEARVEGLGRGGGRAKRKDLHFYEPSGKLALCGEVKLPGSPEGRSPYDDRLYQDAAQKAENAAVRFFFTWNVNVFVLWDRSQWDKPILERRVREWKLGRNLGSPHEVARPENLEFIKTRFLPDLLRDLGDIYTGRRRDWTMPPDDIFIRSLESHLDWPVQLTTTYLIERTARSKKFDADVQRWLTDQDWLFVRGVPEEWHKALSNMTKTLAYVWANRLIFYKALRARFPELPRLSLKRSIKTPQDAALTFDAYFKKAVKISGDYEPLLFPNTEDWATALVFAAPNALDAWRGLLRGIESVDFKDVPSDIVGRIFQKLIGPEERHRYGQHFTGDDVVDLINAFCIRDGADTILDPACGSGSFLVRAYYRKEQLDRTRDHVQLLSELFGCDIALYPAHLATLNLAAREINDEANYPRIVRQDFFAIERNKPFVHIPDNAGKTIPVHLPEVRTVVGNPPYVRQEKIDKRNKAQYAARVTSAWPDLKLSGRADLHCYFWPVATKLLTPDGCFGFLTSSSWLDVEYGFALQGWILRHFKLLAVMESAAEPWFPDARVKTAVTILQRCEDEAERRRNVVRFVRFDRPLKDIIGRPSGNDESARQRGAVQVRDRILSATQDFEDNDLRIIAKLQRDLWNDGVRAGTALRDADVDSEVDDHADDDNGRRNEQNDNETGTLMRVSAGDYVAGKWGRYVRAPDFYFEIMQRFGSRFVPLGEIASIRRGITSGCDAFFMPRDITEQLLREFDTDGAFRRRAGGAPRKDVVSGNLRIIQAGDGSLHPIEAEFFAPEVHSLMGIDRPVVRNNELDRVVLMVAHPMKDLRGTWVYKYLKYGEQATFSSKKARTGPIPERSTCAARDPWYDLTRLIKPSFAFWPKGQQYRHMVIENPDGCIANCRLYYLHTDESYDKQAFVAILNSTLVALWRNFYGRYTGTEGALETMVADACLTEVPDPRDIDRLMASSLKSAFRRMHRRVVGDLVEEQLMDCHLPERARRIATGPLVLSGELLQEDRRALDGAVFELLGVTDRAERSQLVHRLHEATARHFRHIRVVEIEKQEQRARTSNRRFTVQELAADAWDAADLQDAAPLSEWLSRQPNCTAAVNVPDERPAQLSPSPMFDPNAVYFGKKRNVHVDCESRGQGELIAFLANVGLSGCVHTPPDEEDCVDLLNTARMRMKTAEKRFIELVESRTSDERLQEQIIEQLMRWYVHGRERVKKDPVEQEA